MKKGREKAKRDFRGEIADMNIYKTMFSPKSEIPVDFVENLIESTYL